MLEQLFGSNQGVSSGMVRESLLNGQYRVMFQGRQTVATSQAGILKSGQQITVANTAAGLVVVSAGQVSAGNHVEVIING